MIIAQFKIGNTMSLLNVKNIFHEKNCKPEYVFFIQVSFVCLGVDDELKKCFAKHVYGSVMLSTNFC